MCASWHTDRSVSSLLNNFITFEIIFLNPRWKEEYALESGNFDVTSINPRFTDKIPSETQMGKVYARLVDSITPSGGNFADSIISVYASPICETIDNYNSSAYYEPSYVQTKAYLNGTF